MATTIHLSPELLKRVDKRAAELGISRNRYVVRALEKAIEEESTWTQRFLDELEDAAADVESHTAVDDMMEAIVSKRSRKGPPEL